VAHPQKFWLVTALLAILTATLIGCNQVSTFEHEIQVRGADTDTPISNAVVIARMGTRDEVEAVSNADGKAQLVIDEKYHNAWVKVMVEAEGYQRQSVLVKLVDNAPPHIVQLQPPGAEPTSQPAVEATPSPTESNEQPPLDTGAMTPQADSSASELAAIPHLVHLPGNLTWGIGFGWYTRTLIQSSIGPVGIHPIATQRSQP